jgi:FKBP-type peptidyl-prolyl cis-trans isomerase 2
MRPPCSYNISACRRTVKPTPFSNRSFSLGFAARAECNERRDSASHYHEIKDKTVVVDLNHPLAGKTLNFDVKVTDIKAAEAR